MHTLERVGLAGAGTVAGAVGLYQGVGMLYESQRRRNLPDGGATASILPYYAEMISACRDNNLVVASAGGIVKQALGDPFTEFDIGNREFFVSENPESPTLKKATLYRPDPELNLRDLDLRLKRRVYNGIASPVTTADSKVKRELVLQIQKRLNETAVENGFPRGPILSLFTYELPFERGFRPTDYATRTFINEDGSETLFDNNGNYMTLAEEEPWHCVVPTPQGDLRIPTDSPQTILGRTLTRPVVTRRRDASDVASALVVIKDKELEYELLPDWSNILEFRRQLDSSISIKAALQHGRSGRLVEAAGMVAALAVIPLAGSIEESYIGMAIRDPNSPIFPIMERIMGVAR